MYENNISSIKRAQDGNELEMEKLIQNNNRTYLEHSKKIYK